jgi:hypothetical protein
MPRLGARLFLLVLAAVASPLRADVFPSECLWVPQGFRILTPEDFDAEIQHHRSEVFTANDKILNQALASRSDERLQALYDSVQECGKHVETDEEKHYVSLVTVRIRQVQKSREEELRRAKRQRDFDLLLERQEAESQGLVNDPDLVEKEALRLQDLLAEGKTPFRDLYLQALRPLRARPWNHEARDIVTAVLNHARSLDDPKDGRNLSDAAIAFIERRRKESPTEGAWPSLEAYIRLRHRGTPGDDDKMERTVRELWKEALALNANDVDTRIFPLLFALADRDESQAGPLLRFAAEAWPDREELKRVLLENADSLPGLYSTLARRAIEKRFDSK